MPELHDLLADGARQLRPSTVPDFDSVVRRSRARHRTRVAVLGTATALVLAAVGALLVLPGDRGDRLEASVAGTVPEGSVAEPRPYPTFSTGIDDRQPLVSSRPLLDVQPPMRSVKWQLVRVWDGGRRLTLTYSPGCEGALDVRFEETTEHVLVQVADPDGASGSFCDVGHRVTLALGAPLGNRDLWHAPLTDPKRAATTPLANRFEGYLEPPDRSWLKDGDGVSSAELSLDTGPEHCGWERVFFLGGPALRAPRDERGPTWVRDPKGVLTHFPAARRDFRARAELPADAAPTGYTQEGIELWTAPSDGFEFVYLVNADDRSDVERWVRGGGGCA